MPKTLFSVVVTYTDSAKRTIATAEYSVRAVSQADACEQAMRHVERWNVNAHATHAHVTQADALER